MGIAHIALAVVVAASIGAGTTQVLGIELGELQAVPSSAPPYIFRLPIITPPYDPSALAAVTVRQPPDVISFVKRNVVELRLRALSDIELEVSQGGQTLNRLLLMSELQVARLRLEEAPTLPPPSARGKGRDRPLTEAMLVSSAAQEAADRTVLEHEMAGIRQEIQDLVGRVTPWEGHSAPPGALGEDIAAAVVPLLLGGLVIAGITALIMGYVMQHQRVHRERRRRRALTVSIRRLQDQLAAEVTTLPAMLPAPRSRVAHDAQAPVTVLQRLRVSHTTRQRLRLRALSGSGDATQERAVERIRQLAQTSQRVPSTPAELVEALAQLRHELMRLQGKGPTSATPHHRDAGPGPGSR
jgi:hypothetical protein